MNAVDQHEEAASVACAALIIQIPENPLEKQVQFFTCFFVDLGSNWFLVTAEHVYDGLATVHESPYVARNFILPYGKSADYRTEFVFDRDRWLTTAELAHRLGDNLSPRIKEAIIQADLAAMIVPAYYRDNLISVGVRPFKVEQMSSPDGERVEGLMRGASISARLIGVPCATVSSSSGSASAYFLRLPVAPVREEPPFSFWKPTWKSADLPHDVRGTSGGPVVLVGLDHPYVVGVQISQKREDGVVIFKSTSPEAFVQVLQLARYGQDDLKLMMD